jgi:hypothetical protein
MQLYLYLYKRLFIALHHRPVLNAAYTSRYVRMIHVGNSPVVVCEPSAGSQGNSIVLRLGSRAYTPIFPLGDLIKRRYTKSSKRWKMKRELNHGVSPCPIAASDVRSPHPI